MDIPDEAVEAADKVFNDLFEIGQAFGPGYVREMLEAAAPHMVREAKADAYDEGFDRGSENYHRDNPYRS